MKIFNTLLLALVFACALAHVIVRHETRSRYTELRALDAQRNTLIEERGRIQLELGTWASHDRIEYIARYDLGLQPASGARLIILQP